MLSSPSPVSPPRYNPPHSHQSYLLKVGLSDPPSPLLKESSLRGHICPSLLTSLPPSFLPLCPGYNWPPAISQTTTPLMGHTHTPCGFAHISARPTFPPPPSANPILTLGIWSDDRLLIKTSICRQEVDIPTSGTLCTSHY